jgi:hypothetical protein
MKYNEIYSRLYNRVVVPARQPMYRSLSGRYDNPLPESTTSPRSEKKNFATGPSYIFYRRKSFFIYYFLYYVCSDMKEFPFLLQLVLRRREVHPQPLFKVPHLFKPFNNIPTYPDMFFLKILQILRLIMDEI